MCHKEMIGADLAVSGMVRDYDRLMTGPPKTLFNPAYFLKHCLGKFSNGCIGRTHSDEGDIIIRLFTIYMRAYYNILDPTKYGFDYTVWPRRKFMSFIREFLVPCFL